MNSMGKRKKGSLLSDSTNGVGLNQKNLTVRATKQGRKKGGAGRANAITIELLREKRKKGRIPTDCDQKKKPMRGRGAATSPPSHRERKKKKKKEE